MNKELNFQHIFSISSSDFASFFCLVGLEQGGGDGGGGRRRNFETFLFCVNTHNFSCSLL
jgi:hypothetical protein